MPERDWRQYALDRLVPGTLIAGALLALVVLSFLIPNKLGYNQARDAESAEHAEQASEVCIKLPPAISYCPRPESDAGNAEADRSGDDLKAQQEMADWAFGVVLISSLGLIASLVGVVLVYATFRKTAESLDHTVKHGRAEMRAYVGVHEISGPDIDGGGRWIKAKIEFRNTGSSPARKVTIHCRFVVEPMPFQNQWLEGLGTDVPAESSSGLIMPGGPAVVTPILRADAKNEEDRLDPAQLHAALGDEPTVGVWVFGVVNYEDIFRWPHWTTFRYRMKKVKGLAATFSPTAEGNDTDD